MQLTVYRSLDRLIPEMRPRIEAFLDAAAKTGMPILIMESWRSVERQKYLYSIGRTQPGPILTWTLNSSHMNGTAVDIAFHKEGKPSYKGDWEAIGRIGEKHGLHWGGRWPIPDSPHFEMNFGWKAT